MEKEDFKLRTIEYLSGTLDEQERVIFEGYLTSNPKFLKEFKELQFAWNQLDNLESPQPSQSMDEGFYKVLHQQMTLQEEKGRSLSERLQLLLHQLWKPQLAYGAVLLGVGLAAGYFVQPKNTVEPSVKDKTTIVDSDQETEEVREMLVLTLLDQPSANKRLQAVSEATKLNAATERVISALFTTLNKDPNINVRLAAIESLARYVEKPEVRMGFIQSIGQQESPLVQIALADLMVKLQEKSSVDPMKQLLEQPDIDTTVKQKIEESINHII